MKELLEYRVKMMARLEEAAREFVAACKTRDAFAAVAGSEWNIHQLAFHARDVDKFVYGERIQKTLHEDNPGFKEFDVDAWTSAHYDKDEALEKILDEFLKNITRLCDSLRALPREAWSRESSHETFGDRLTLQLWVERSVAHIEEHLKTLK